MRRFFAFQVAMVVIVFGALSGACQTAPKPAVEPPVVASKTPGQPPPPAVVNQKDALSTSGLPSAVADAVRKHIAGDDRYSLSHWIAVDDGYYLVELTVAPSAEHVYLWIASGGMDSTFFTGSAENAELVDSVDGACQFLCDRMGDSISVFPFYEVATAGKKPEQAPFLKTPNADVYSVSSPGLAYELRKVASTGTSIDLLFMITGPDPDGVMAGGPRPPAARVIESDRSVSVRLWYVSLAPSAEEALRALPSLAGRLENVSCKDGCLDLEFSVPWTYSVSLINEKAEPGPGDRSSGLRGYRISFLPKPPATGTGTDLHKALTSVTGIRFGAATITAPRLLGELQRYLLRAFPLQREPAEVLGGVDVALMTGGQWVTQKQGYYPGAEGRPSYLEWRGRWYEVDPCFDALLRTAGTSARDTMGETPDAVVGRYIGAMFFRDWKSAYACLGTVPEDLTLSKYAGEAERIRRSGTHYRAEGYEMKDADVASVSVTADRWGGPSPSSSKESWTCVRENGLWKLRWQPK